jgi:hypothetical protein
MRTSIFLVTFILLLNTCPAQLLTTDSSYLGQTPPGSIPQIFAPGVVSLSNRFETYPTFSPDGKEMFFSVVNAAWTTGTIFHTQELNGNWTVPDTAVFSKDSYYNLESFISPDGNRQFFTSNRPPSLNTDIWVTVRTSDTTWTNPSRLNSPVNSNTVDGSACVTNNGTLYFKSLRGGGIGGSILYRAKLIDSAYSQVENLGGIIQTTSGEAEPFMAPDESYLIFTSQSRAGGYNGYDLWICFRKSDSSWTSPKNMGSNINTSNDEYGPRVTQDGKYLFFTRENRGVTMDIYWVSASIIDSLRSTVISVNQTHEQAADRYKLFQNYPNPFNPSTVISYSLLSNGNVRIKLYDALGREITTLVNSFQKRGFYDINLDMNNLSIASGVYYYTLTVNEQSSNEIFKETKVMCYIK